MHDPANNVETRLTAAKSAAPSSPLLSFGKEGGPIETVEITDADRAAAIMVILKSAQKRIGDVK